MFQKRQQNNQSPERVSIPADTKTTAKTTAPIISAALPRGKV